MNEEKFKIFADTYIKALHKAVIKYPDDYRWYTAGSENIDFIAAKMHLAFRKQSFDKDSHAIKATCKELSIKHTYKAIAEYLEQTKEA